MTEPAPDTALAIEKAVAAAGCRLRLAVLEIDGPGGVSIRGDEPANAASCFKIAVVLELFCQAAAGSIDLRERLRLSPRRRTAGGQGFCLFEDEVEASLRDIARMMLTISDNTATDALIRRISSDRIQSRLDALGLSRTAFTGTVAEHFERIAQAAGFTDHGALQREFAAARSAAQREAMRSALAAACAPESAGAVNSTTARDMARLVRMIWRDDAGPAQACAHVRAVLGQQRLTRKIANGFGDDAVVATKSGTIGGVASNDVGMVELADGRRYAVAVLTETVTPGSTEQAVNAAIGEAARLAVEHLSGRRPNRAAR